MFYGSLAASGLSFGWALGLTHCGEGQQMFIGLDFGKSGVQSFRA